MCLPACAVQLAEAASTLRSFLRRAAVAAAGAALAPMASAAAADVAPSPRLALSGRIVDLKHTLGSNFPFPVDHAFELEPVNNNSLLYVTIRDQCATICEES